MRESVTDRAGRLRARVGIGFALAAGLLLGGCQSASDLTGKFFGARTPGTPKKVTELDESFLGVGYCPKIKIRPGTESLVQFDKSGDRTNENVRYLQSITRTARECRYPGGQLTLKIGVAGRVVAGPKGGPGKVVAPVRIAILKADAVAYSEVQNVEVTLAAPQLSTDFARVVEVPVASGPGEQDVEVYVGFDDEAQAKKRQ